MNKRHLLTAFFIGTTLIWQSCGNKDAQKQQAAQQAEKVVQVTFATATEEVVTGNQAYPATVKPLNESDLFAEVSGYVTKIYVTDGASVSKGQKLYEIDGTRYTAALDQARANLKIAQSNFDRVQTDLNRYQALADKDAIAKQTLDYAKTDLANQKAQIVAAQAAVTTAQTNLNRSTIRAPFAGIVGISDVRLGALVNPGTTKLNTVSSINPIAVEIQVSERDIPQFVALQKSGTASQISATLPDGTAYTSAGRIATIDRAVDPQTGTIKVRANFENPSNILRAGMNVSLNIKTNSTKEEVVIPYKAIQDQLGVFNVYVVGDSSKAEHRQVELGLKLGDKVVVKSGVKVGEKIIVDGIMNVQPGVKVTDTPPASTAAPAKK
ncbi:efflux RND transporter periplasmic adaptor subunit [Sphingobacterium sp. SRCM116780]|uniref:efflux RND transporter periplasmic adaptor subunit n=1 Tax=Sphingobacterium sp. SRCM116780 TaxID=2907623 RepID=UPI001F2677EC|nr:efflux RND transporter periplasmic adaptor subunit [Sphingobacterium sp. SRCM116780]UIR54522.1 efflux RND transporter periplasmic adaptor subunit [Sphingobacterium sp. SRCM116780]